MTKRIEWRLDEIVARLGGELAGDGAVRVGQVGSLAAAGPGQIAFLANPKFRRQLAETRASAVILSPKNAGETELPRILHPNPYAYYARVVALLNPPAKAPAGIHPSAVVDSPLPASVRVGANAVIGRDVLIADDVVIHPGVVIGDGVAVGEGSCLYANVVVAAGCQIGKRAVIQSGAVIGGDGFGFAKDGDDWVKIPQIGRVIIGDDVEIGANTTVDRGALDDTVIGNGVKLDNQIQIAHNVVIGDYTAMAGCAGVAGSTRIGARCTIGGAAMIVGHIEIADGVHVSAGTLVSKSIPKPGHYTGVFPFDSHDHWLHNAAQLRHLDALAQRIKELETKIASLEKT